VALGGPFWGPRLAALRAATLEANLQQCAATGRLANFDRAAAVVRGEPAPGAFEGLLFNDSDVHKVVEGLALLVATERDAARRAGLEGTLRALVGRIAAAQHPDGYLDTYFTLKAGMADRLMREESDHETYCMGHLIEAGVAHFEATGERTLLAVAERAAAWMRAAYGPDRCTTPPGHQEVELALVRLADATGRREYLEFAHELLEHRGRPHRRPDGSTCEPWGDYAQDHLPVVRQMEAAGHAVRAAYMYAAMADLAARGHMEYAPALESLWRDVTERRIFVTGGIGPSGHNEGFTVPYDIPIEGAYQETCASIALCLWAHRMYLLTGEARFMEQFERTLYNAALAGVALDGRTFFYANPMTSRGTERRQAWFACACCPPNVLRFFAGLGQYVFAVTERTISVCLPMEASATVPVPGGVVEIAQATGYPCDGRVSLAVANRSPAPVTVAVRGDVGPPDVPLGADGFRVFDVPAGGRATRDWEVPLEPRRVRSDPRVAASRGHVALARGPLVYAAEGVDNGGTVEGVVLAPDAPVRVAPDPSGIPRLVASVERPARRPSGRAEEDAAKGAPLEPGELVLVPYFMWCNRGPGPMRVWLPQTRR
jgi:DUF1680 family protein